MTSVDSIYGLYQAADSTGASSSTSSQDVDALEFLEIFLVQLENQDPTEPMDTSEMTSQLCSYSQLEQAILTNGYLAEQIDYFQSAFNAGAAQLIDRNVAVEGNSLNITGDDASTIVLELEGSLPELTITIFDEEGNQVDQFTAENLSSGRNTIEWDGIGSGGEVLPDGEYTYEVEPVGAEYSDFDIQTYSSLRVLSAMFLDGEAYLQTSSGRQISYSKVTQVM